MNSITKNKWQLRVAAVVVFLLGAAAGALAPRAYYAWTGRQHQRVRFEEMLERLKLSAEQETHVRQVLGETRERLRALDKENEPREQEIRRQADERLRQVLTPEQLRQFQQMMADRQGSRRGRGGRGGGGGPPKN